MTNQTLSKVERLLALTDDQFDALVADFDAPAPEEYEDLRMLLPGDELELEMKAPARFARYLTGLKKFHDDNGMACETTWDFLWKGRGVGGSSIGVGN